MKAALNADDTFAGEPPEDEVAFVADDCKRSAAIVVVAASAPITVCCRKAGYMRVWQDAKFVDHIGEIAESRAANDADSRMKIVEARHALDRLRELVDLVVVGRTESEPPESSIRDMRAAARTQNAFQRRFESSAASAPLKCR